MSGRSKSMTKLSKPIGLLLTIVLAGCGAQAEAPDANAALRAVEVAVPQARGGRELASGQGRVEAAAEARLSFKLGGVVREIAVDIGDTVRKGQVLARLDQTEIAAQVARAEQLAAKAERDLSRAAEVYGRGLIAREARDNAATARDVAAADLRQARFNQRFATIIAPADGRVMARMIDAGEIVAAGQQVLSVSGESQGWLLKLDLADRDALKIEPGAAASVRFAALPGVALAAVVSRVGGSADPRTGTIEVELALDAAGAPLRSGLIGRAEIETNAERVGLAVPVSALIEANGDSGRLIVIEDGVARIRKVALGALEGGSIAVLEGVAARDAVVIGGAAWLDDGQRVRVIAASEG
jgi:RND family efflux transporter MFP subunit